MLHKDGLDGVFIPRQVQTYSILRCLTKYFKITLSVFWYGKYKKRINSAECYQYTGRCFSISFNTGSCRPKISKVLYGCRDTRGSSGL